MDNPKISIIVPVYNVEKYISQCLDSLVRQTLKEIEIICIDDGSGDRSFEILKDYGSRDSRLLAISQPNGGVSAARNNGLKYVHGEYYMFVDSDDWLDVETCMVAFDVAKKEDADCLMFSYTKEFGTHCIVNHIFEKKNIVWDDEEVKNNFHRRLFGPVGKELSRPQDMDLLVTPCMQLFKTSKFKDIQFIDIRETGTFEDGLYQMVLYNDCKRFVYIDKPYYHYRKTNESSITTRYQKDLPEQFQNLWNIIEGYMDKYRLDDSYSTAFSNRVALSMVSLGLNEIKGRKGLINASIGGGEFTEYQQNKRICQAA